MMGKDCERILSSLNKMISITFSAVKEISKLNAPPIKVNAEHSHDKYGNSSKIEFIETETNIPMDDKLRNIFDSLEELSDDIGKLNALEEGLYTESTSFNNSIGSPWTEIKQLKNAINELSSSCDSNYIGDRNVIVSSLTSILPLIVDAKWAIIYYHDYIQRGFDNIFNNNEPSIIFKKNYKNDELDVKKTIGIRNQEIENNVHIRKGNYDPF